MFVLLKRCRWDAFYFLILVTSLANGSSLTKRGSLTKRASLINRNRTKDAWTINKRIFVRRGFCSESFGFGGRNLLRR